jgi:hypothetical protein
LRAPFLDNLSAAQACRRRASRGIRTGRGRYHEACRRTDAISHKMSRRYHLEYPVDDPDEEEDDDFDDEDDDDGEDEDDDEEEVETWQVGL